MGKLTKAERKAMQQERTQAKQERKQEKQERRESKKSEPIAQVKVETPVKVAPIVQPVKKSEPKKVKKDKRKWNINLRSIPKGLLGLIWSLVKRFTRYPISGLGRIIGFVLIPVMVMRTATGTGWRIVSSLLTTTLLRLQLAYIGAKSSDELKRHAVSALLMIGTFVFCYWIATL